MATDGWEKISEQRRTSRRKRKGMEAPRGKEEAFRTEKSGICFNNVEAENVSCDIHCICFSRRRRRRT
jgi:hypothetical protein